ncbi:unnamed protein product [Diabrotica balteata]|uniref:GIY-YIG domain-containing protein n=1 Tax=Diabrotica balteata TaxID=107213 RepID=A0A9N9SNJ3_DIABA|nr:unnamed protein product [Diabrotica balteata]
MISLPYIKELTPRLARVLNSFYNFKIANKTVFSIKNLHTKVKDKTSREQMSHVVYSIPCKNCNKKYIGHTERHLKNRIISHKSDCRLHHDRCSLALHVVNEGHQMDFESVEVLERETNYKKRLFLEMACIAQTENNINKKTDINHLSEIYSFLLAVDKQHMKFNNSIVSILE